MKISIQTKGVKVLINTRESYKRRINAMLDVVPRNKNITANKHKANKLNIKN